MAFLSQKFSWKDLDVASNIFDIYSDRCNWILGLSQSRYINFMLKEFNINKDKSIYLSIYSMYQAWCDLCLVHDLWFQTDPWWNLLKNCEKCSQSTWEVLDEQWIEKVPNSKLCLTQLNAVSGGC